MSRTHGKADIFLDGTLAYKLGIVIEQPTVNRLILKVRDETHPSRWVIVLTLNDVTYGGRDGTAQRWTGEGPDGSVELTMVPRAGGCRSCGG